MMIYIVMLFLILYVYFVTQKEGFEQRTDEFQGKVFRNEKMYDSFYAYNYDDIRLTMPYLVKMAHVIRPYFQPGRTLCLGSKNGHVVQLLSEAGAVGAETSSAMVEISRYKYPDLKFIHGKFTVDLFPSHSFSQVVVPLWILHTIQHLPDLMFSMKEWTTHTGYLFLCFIDIHAFPVEMLMPSPSEYFMNHYEYGLEITDKQWIDTIQDRYFRVRTNIQDMYPYSEKMIVETARSVGLTHMTTLPLGEHMSVAIFQNK